MLKILKVKRMNKIRTWWRYANTESRVACIGSLLALLGLLYILVYGILQVVGIV